MKPTEQLASDTTNSYHESTVANLTPSIVARQQRSFQQPPIPAPRSSHLTHHDHHNPQQQAQNPHVQQQQFDQNGLILPKRLTQNPNLVMLNTNLHNNNHMVANHNNNNTTTHNQNYAHNQQHHHHHQQQPIIRDLNRELKFNQTRGKNVLDQKSELKRVQEKMADARRRKEQEQERLNRRSSLELRLEERAQKIAKDGQAA